MPRLQLLVALIILFSCTENQVPNSTAKTIEPLELKDSSRITTQVHSQADSLSKIPALNYTDARDMKQGQWKSYLNGKIWKNENYVDGNLHGKRWTYQANGDVDESNYINGVQQGYFMHYKPGAIAAIYASLYEEGKRIWSTFPIQIHNFMIPIKGFSSEVESDSLRIRVPYNSGKLLSEGLIDRDGAPFGDHQVYLESGELRAIVHYDSDSISTFDLHGHLEQKIAIRDIGLTTLPAKRKRH